MLNKVTCRTRGTEKKDLERQINLCQPLLKKIMELINEDLKHLDIVDDDDFDNPSWALKQAYKVGYKKGLTKLLEYGIIEHVEK